MIPKQENNISLIYFDNMLTKDEQVSFEKQLDNLDVLLSLYYTSENSDTPLDQFTLSSFLFLPQPLISNND